MTGEVTAVESDLESSDSSSPRAVAPLGDVVSAPPAPPTTFRSMFTDVGNMLKAFIGLNFMYVAFAFAQAGILRGAIGLIFIAVVTEHCCLLLIKVKDAMPPRFYPNGTPRPPTYGDIARFVGGRPCGLVVNTALALTQFGYCVGYLIFISQTLHDLMKSHLSFALFVFIPVPVLIGLAMLKSIRSLGPISQFANFTLLTGFIAVVVYIALNFEWKPSSPSIMRFPLFFGQITAALEGIGLVVPVETSMRNRAQFPLVLRISLVILTTILMTVGILGFATFGEGTKDIILLNFKHSPKVVSSVKLILVFGILFTYPLQIVPVFQLVEAWLLKKVQSSGRRSRIDESAAVSIAVPVPVGRRRDADTAGAQPEEVERLNAESDVIYATHTEIVPVGRKERWIREPLKIFFRVLIILSTAAIAMVAGKKFGLVQSLVGSLGASCLAYSAPAFFHVYVFGAQLTTREKIKDWLIFVFGVTGALLGTGASLHDFLFPTPKT